MECSCDLCALPASATPVFFSCGLWCPCRTSSLNSELLHHGTHIICPCPAPHPSGIPPRAPGGLLEGSWQEQSELCNCSLPLLDSDCLVFVVYFNAVLPDLCSEPEPGPRQPPLCHALLPGPPRSPGANQGCFHVLLGRVAFKSELLMVEKMPLSVLGSLQQLHQGCCWRQK